MSMYTEITITLPTLFDEAEATEIMGTWLDDAAEFFEHDEYVSATEGGGFQITITDNNKYQLENLHYYAKEFTKSITGSQVDISEDWTGEENALETSTYRDGKLVGGKHTELVDDNVGALVAAVRAALDTTSDTPLDDLTYAVVDLLNALDPQPPAHPVDCISCRLGVTHTQYDPPTEGDL